jgi:hypothetical protein
MVRLVRSFFNPDSAIFIGSLMSFDGTETVEADKVNGDY